ncbi:hypothetical protein MXB_1892, partial [Myxobolus squamalis]
MAENIRSDLVMRRELDYASHLSVQAISFKFTKYSHVALIANIIKEFHENSRLRMQVVVNISTEYSDIDTLEFDYEQKKLDSKTIEKLQGTPIFSINIPSCLFKQNNK